MHAVFLEQQLLVDGRGIVASEYRLAAAVLELVLDPRPRDAFRDDDAGEVLLGGEPRADDRTDAVPEHVDVRRIGERVAAQRVERDAVARGFGGVVDRGTRRPLAVADAALLQPHRDEAASA